MTEQLGTKSAEVLRFIKDYQRRYECAPTVREIGEGVRLGSTNTVSHHLKTLKSLGYIRQRGNLARGIEVVDRNDPHDGGPKGARIVRLPITGEIAAGLPIQANVNSDDWVDLPTSMAGGPDAYILRVRGDSMIDEHICSGDLVVVQPQQTARNGEIVVALLADNGVTLKKFYREKDHIRLQPANPTMAPIIVHPDDFVGIQGTVKTVIRQTG